MRVIFKSIIDVIPIFIEIVTIVIFTTLIYSIICSFLYSGVLNTEFLEKFEEVTGDEIDESYLMLNFNDSISSFYYIMDIALKGGYGDLINNLLII